MRFLKSLTDRVTRLAGRIGGATVQGLGYIHDKCKPAVETIAYDPKQVFFWIAYGANHRIKSLCSSGKLLIITGLSVIWAIAYPEISGKGGVPR